MLRLKAGLWWFVAAIVALLPVAMIGFYALYSADQSMRQLVRTDNLAVARMAVELLDNSLDHSVELASTVAKMPGFVAAVRHRDVDAVRDRLRRTVELNPAVDRAYVMDKPGVLWSDWPVAPESINRSFAHRDYFKGLSRAWEPYISEVFQRQAEPRPLVVAVAVPIKDENGQVLGGLVLQHRLGAITTWLQRATVGNNGHVIVLDQNGIVAGHPHLQLAGTRHEEYARLQPVRDALQGKSSTVEYLDPVSRRTAVATFQPLAVGKDYRWVVIAQQDRQTAYAPVTSLGMQIGLATLAVAVLALVAALVLARSSEHNRRMRVALAEQNERLQQAVASERQAHDALKTAQGQLVQSGKLAGLGQMAAGVAHEINNPLSFVSNNVAVLQRDVLALREAMELYCRCDAALREHEPQVMQSILSHSQRVDLPQTLEELPDLLASSRDGLKRIQQIVRDLREFARIDETMVHEADLNAGIESTANIIGGNARSRQVRIELSLGRLPAVTCCLAKINQVVMNLLSNAVDASHPGGIVTVRTWAEDREVRIEISDAGTGIDPAIRDRIFDPFFSTKKQGDGMGLGLSISYGIVKEHHGAIDVDSTPGQGSRFTVRLPLHPPPKGGTGPPERADRQPDSAISS